MCSKIVAKGLVQGRRNNHIFFWKHQFSLVFLSFVISKWASFPSALLSDRCTSQTPATACTQRSLEHLGVPLAQAMRSELRKQVTWSRIFPMANVPLHLQQGTRQVFESIYGSINPCWEKFFDEYTVGCTQPQTLESMKHCSTVTFAFKNTVNICSWNGNC